MALTDAEQVELLDLLLEQKRDEARQSLLRFSEYTFEDYRPNWHHEVICQYLDALLASKFRKLLIFAPPRHGKSELVSRRLPAYAFGRNPDEQIIACSYSDDLASRMNRDIKRIIQSEAYRELFPSVQIPGIGIRNKQKKKNNSDFFELIGSNGAYRSAGVGGGITGMGATLGIIDDPIKNQKEALSHTIRQAHWEWYVTTYRTRMQKNSRELLTLTRWHEDDLAGRIAAMVKAGVLDGGDWVTLTLPAINDSGPTADDPRAIGDPLWPSEYSVSFLNEMRVTLGPTAFNAIYQQRPTAPEGGIIKRKWIADAIYTRLPEGCRFLLSADLTFDKTENGSYNVIQCWAWLKANFYLVDQFRGRCDFVEVLSQFNKMVEKYPQATTKLVEKKANGSALISVLKSKVSGIIPVNPRGSKIERLTAVSPLFEAGNVHFPAWHIAPWVGECIEEIVSFPNAKNDDQVDTTSQALNRLRDESITIVSAGSVTRSAPIPR